MKFFHLSDLHIGLKLLGRDLMEDQRHILDQICELAAREQPDAVVIAGDIYDKAVPSAEAVDLLNHFIDRLTDAVPAGDIMLISGNHDNAVRLNCFRGILSKQHVHMIGLPPQTPQDGIERVTIYDADGPVNFYLLPFVKPSMIRQIVGVDEHGNNFSYEVSVQKLIAREEMDPSQRNVLVSHQFYIPAGHEADDVERMESEIRTVGNIDAITAEVLDAFDYAALGHIHKPMKVGSDVLRYCGTPLACSVSEAGQRKGIIMVEIREKQVNTTVLPLVPLREVRRIKGTVDEVLAQRCDDYVSITLLEEAAGEPAGEVPGGSKDSAKMSENISEAAGGKAANISGEKHETGKDAAADLQDRLRSAFPYLLEIRRETIRTADYSAEADAEKQMDPYALCCAFLKNPDDEEKALLRDVINTVGAQ